MFRKGLDTLIDLGTQWDMARTPTGLGRSVAALGDDAEAKRLWLEAVHIASETRGMPVTLDAMVGLASLRAKAGDSGRAFELLVYVLNQPGCLRETRDRAHSLYKELEVHLTSQQVDAAQVRAQAGGFEAMLDEPPRN